MTSPADDLRAAADATLPGGATCGDCRHLMRCLKFGYTDSRERRECDWTPIRFRQREVTDADRG